MTLYHASPSPSDCAKLQRLLDRYRDLLTTAKDELLRRGIMSQIASLEQKLRECEEECAERPRPGGAAPGHQRGERPHS